MAGMPRQVGQDLDLKKELAWLRKRAAMARAGQMSPSGRQHPEMPHANGANGANGGSPRTHRSRVPRNVDTNTGQESNLSSAAVSPRPMLTRASSNVSENSHRYQDAADDVSESNYSDAAREQAAMGEGSALMRPLTFVQIQILAFIVVFSVSGLVPSEDMSFAIMVSLYLVALAWFVFPSAVKERTLLHPFFESLGFNIYRGVGIILGLFLPLADVLGGFARGNHQAVRAAAPHLFLVSCEILTGNIINHRPSVSVPMKAIVPVVYNARRLFTLAAWLRLSKAADRVGAAVGSAAHTAGTFSAFGRFLAVTNYFFWSFNLFCFLLPIYLPYAFRVHWEEVAESKRRPRTLLYSLLGL